MFQNIWKKMNWVALYEENILFVSACAQRLRNDKKTVAELSDYILIIFVVINLCFGH